MDDIDQLIAELHASGGVPSGGAAAGRHQPAGRVAAAPHRRGGQRPAAGGRRPAVDPRRGTGPPARGGAARRRGHRGRGPARRWRRTRGASTAQAQIADGSFRMQGLGRFRINLHRERGRAAATLRALPSRVPRLATLGLPPSVELLTPPAARPGPHRRSDRIGQDHDARGAGRRDQPARRAPHRDHRGSDRVRAPASQRHRRAGGDRRRRARLSDRAARVAAPGARRHRRRRDARSRDDADRAGGGRDRASRAVDRPHHRRRVDGGADCRLVPRRAAEHDPPGAVDGAGRGHDADAAAEDRRRPGAGRGAADGRATARASTSARTRCSTCIRR